MGKSNPFLSLLVQKINDRIVVLQAGATIELLKGLMEDCWTKMDELENTYRKLRAFSMPLISESIEENCFFTKSSQFTDQTMQSAMSLLSFFKNLHANDNPIAVKTQSTWKRDVPENPLSIQITKLTKINPIILSGRPLQSENKPTICEDPQIVQLRLNTLQRLERISNISE